MSHPYLIWLALAVLLLSTCVDIAISLYTARVYREHIDELRRDAEVTERLTQAIVALLGTKPKSQEDER